MKKIIPLFLIGTAVSSFAQENSKPNFVLFIADDCSYYDIGCYGSPDALTPNIDRFASEGVKFTKGYQAAPMSSPTRHNLYTGLWPVKSGAYPNHTCAYDGTKSVVHHLKPLGYKVALIGKSHVKPDSVFPFDVYVPDKKGIIDFSAVASFVEECKASGTPFCLFVASKQPHTPWNMGDPGKFNPEKLSIAPIHVDIPETRKEFCKYLAEINYMDDEFGQTLKILDEKQVADNSVVVFLSEQGNTLPFAKWTCYDAGVHSAVLVRWPGVIRPNSVSDAIVEYVDIVPTFVDIAGGKGVSRMDGKSFQNVLKGKKKTHKKYTFSIQTTRGISNGSDFYGIRSVCDGKYRYILNLTPEAKFRNACTNMPLYKKWETLAAENKQAQMITSRYVSRPAIELYDVEKDKYCLENLAENPEYAQIIKRLDVELRNWMKECGDLGQETELKAHERKATFVAKQKRGVMPVSEKKRREKKKSYFSYCNPIRNGIDIHGIRDCQVLRDGDWWYMTATPRVAPSQKEIKGNIVEGVPLYKSKDLTQWTFVKYIVERPSPNSWYYRRFWAPEIHKIKGKYYATFNCSNPDHDYPGQWMGYAVADNIEGPYTVVTQKKPLGNGNDLTFYEDTDERVYAFYNRGREFGIGFCEIDLKKGKFIGEPVSCILPEKVDYEFDKDGNLIKIPGYDGRLIPKVKKYYDWDAIGIEGAYVIKRNGIYYLFYSSWTRGYEIGYATARNIRGPWKKHEGNPIYGAMNKSTCHKNGFTWSGDANSPFNQVGHNEVFTGPDGRLWLSCHGITDDNPEQPALVIDPIDFDEEGNIRKKIPSYTLQTTSLDE